MGVGRGHELGECPWAHLGEGGVGADAVEEPVQGQDVDPAAGRRQVPLGQERGHRRSQRLTASGGPAGRGHRPVRHHIPL